MGLRYSPPHLETGLDEKLLTVLIALKANARKDDPARRQDIYGPYEASTCLRTGRMPEDYYVTGDPEPWGFTIEESRRNIVWQAVSGMLDHQPDFAGAYLALALDGALGDDDYAGELRGLNGDWSSFLRQSGLVRDHHHGHMRSIYQTVACAACSQLAAAAIRDPEMNALFRNEMLPLAPSDRHRLLRDRKLAPLLNAQIPAPTIRSPVFS